MNPEWFGDSYDIVKRFLVEVLRGIGYAVYVDPMPTGEWMSSEAIFLRFIGAQHVRDAMISDKTALLLDPDTGIGKRLSKRHTSIPSIIGELESHNVVFVFDQSFSRGLAPLRQLQEKLRQLRKLGAYGFYYDSHARFLFSSRSNQELTSVMNALLKLGIPQFRIVLPDT